ncbi:hypothetical protein LJC24_04610 [Desulfococcaceae bacterium OttesenSCG-928-F15]|nr:hypothetical protein [Desulfococcaceae bacterium OttesenSCG-928-F15]
MTHEEKKQFRVKIIHAGFLFSLCASFVFFGLFILHSFRKDFYIGGQYLEGIGIIMPTDMSFLLIVLGMAFLFIAFLLRFEIIRTKELP